MIIADLLTLGFQSIFLELLQSLRLIAKLWLLGGTSLCFLLLGGFSSLIILISLWNNTFFRFILIKRVWIAIECDIILMISEHWWSRIDQQWMLIMMIMCIILSEKSLILALIFNLNIIYWLFKLKIHWLFRETSILLDHSINGIWDLIKLWHREMILSDVRLNVLKIQVANFWRLNQKWRWNVRFALFLIKTLNWGGGMIFVIKAGLFAVDKWLRRILSYWPVFQKFPKSYSWTRIFMFF